VRRLLDECIFPPPATHVALAVSGGPDSTGLLLLALEAQLEPCVHHVDHHARASSGDDARFVQRLCHDRGVAYVVHDVTVPPGANFEARARAERRRVLPSGVLSGHTMDDLAETVLLNMLRGAGVEGLSPMVGDPTKPLQRVRRSDLHSFVAQCAVTPVHDESNDDPAFRRNRVRHEIIPLLCDVAQRDVVPLLARQAQVLFDDRTWLASVLSDDLSFDLGSLDCRDLRRWPRARLRRWLRTKLALNDSQGNCYFPSVAEIDRALRVVLGEVVATELSGGRRLARRAQRLTLEVDSTTLTSHG
jgi:tRNA(Ile)-lysidine synthase